MDLLEDYYGKQTFLLYSLFAKVPGMKNWPRRIFIAFSVLLLSFATVYQIMELVAKKFQRNVIIELMPIIAATGGTLLYIPYVAYATEKKYETLLSIMVNDLREERTEEEDAIKREYANSATMITNALTIIFTSGLVGTLFLGFIPNVLDFLIPLNKTRGKQLFVNAGIFIDQEKYFYSIHVFESCVLIVASFIIGVSENMSVIIGHHACGMAAILGLRLENITRIEDNKPLDKDDYTLLVVKKVKVCIAGHQAMLQLVFMRKFMDLIIDFYDVPLTFVLIGIFSALSVSLVQVTDVEVCNLRIAQSPIRFLQLLFFQLINMTMVFLTIIQVIQLFLLSYVGQRASDATERITVNVYNAHWYTCSPKVQKLLQLVILRSSKCCMMVASSMYSLTLANFMSVMQTVTSFYMVLRHTQ